MEGSTHTTTLCFTYIGSSCVFFLQCAFLLLTLNSRHPSMARTPSWRSRGHYAPIGGHLGCHPCLTKQIFGTCPFCPHVGISAGQMPQVECQGAYRHELMDVDRLRSHLYPQYYFTHTPEILNTLCCAELILILTL